MNLSASPRYIDVVRRFHGEFRTPCESWKDVEAHVGGCHTHGQSHMTMMNEIPYDALHPGAVRTAHCIK